MRTLAGGLLGCAVATSFVVAQAPLPKAPEYDPTAEVTIKGTVEEIHESKVAIDHPGLHLTLKTEAGTVEVHLCPVRFLSELEFPIAKGDALTVLGSRPKDGAIVIARRVTKGQLTLVLRDEKGAPIWNH